MTSCIHDHGRWGKGDQLGAGHFLTPERTLKALKSVNEGRIVDMSHVIWRDFDGLGKNTRVGLNFTEKGFGIRPALGAGDFIDVFAVAAGLVGDALVRARRRALDLAGVGGSVRLDRLSGGAMKRLLLGRAVIHDPAVGRRRVNGFAELRIH